MDVKEIKSIEVITDVLCDICDQSTKLEFATLCANWGYYSKSDGERYKLQLCEKCFFNVLAILKNQRKLLNSDKIFDQLALEKFGLNSD
ncbi:hypothetical protein SKM57_06840 [Acinetobacter faecalis]|uniref:hypothetical protein n=1 Tax=Acinetobacter faecalis TaxID=2665161 RepID=UPI002A90DE96|nr:hypothetical protein [Acinetobacter faecalis]MDY6468301.1 hypothetical protein [Acinetobacter faecalis]